MPRSERAIIPCKIEKNTLHRIEAYAQALKENAPEIGDHGLTKQEFLDSGLFQGAIERLRGQQAASMRTKREFVKQILGFMQAKGEVKEWKSAEASERHDYEVRMKDDCLCIVETKGALDGNNTNIFQRPPQADEFVIWSLVQNPSSDPRKNAWSGLHTRLSAEILARNVRVDGVIIWDWVCNTVGRPCPKVRTESRKLTQVETRLLPPPCIYLFPKTIPDPRNNPSPACVKLENVKFLAALHEAFKGNADDVVDVQIQARMEGSELQRKTVFVRNGSEIAASEWVTVRRARR